ncbi:hypothetical protein BGX27_000413 [Mortierella sp. AM989]|nr:hypothetical protein BGX27_000413 [Mortierella sp. AM989]
MMVADAGSIFESLNLFIKGRRGAHHVDSGSSYFDGVYSLGVKHSDNFDRVFAKEEEQTQQQLTVQHQGTGQRLGQWDLVGVSGVSAMHGTLIPNTNKIVFLEKVEKSSNAYLPDDDKHYSWSVEYDVEEAIFRPLHTTTNMFCSAGGYRPDGTIVSLGGAEAQANIVEGWNSLRFLSACSSKESKCDWDIRSDITLLTGRWYPTVEALADGRLFIIGGATRGASMNSKEIGVVSWELYPPLPSNPTYFDFLEETMPYNLYPMAHLLPDGNLFIFANTRAIVFSTETWSIIKDLPDLPGPPRNYPLSGGSVLLPIRPENNYEAEILICGGATDFSSRAKGQDQCGRIKPLSDDPEWIMEDMPIGRMMPDLVIVADGSVIIFNGANKGTAGYGRASEPVMHPIRYQPWDSEETEQLNSRFTLLNPSYIPRLYHSIAMPVLDGRILVAGSNPNANTMDLNEYPVEYRVEMFSPGYLLADVPRPLLKAESTIGRTINRPAALSVQDLQTSKSSPERGQGDGDTNENVISYDTVFEIEVEFYGGAMSESQIISPIADPNNRTPSRVQVNLMNGGFSTHSTHMSHRMVGLEIVGYVQKEGELNRLRVKGPRNGALAPPGWYQMTVVENGIPSEGTWQTFEMLLKGLTLATQDARAAFPRAVTGVRRLATFRAIQTSVHSEQLNKTQWRNANQLKHTSLYDSKRLMMSASGSNDLTRATALVYFKYGHPSEVLKVLKHTLEPPAEDSVQVQFLASPINPADINQVEGVYPLKPAMTSQLYSSSSSFATPLSPDSDSRPPVAVGGNEGVAKVTKVGSKVGHVLKVGDWVVMGSAGLGTWRSHGNFKAKDLTKVRSVEKMNEGADSSDLDVVQLATLTVNPCTAYRMLRDFKTLSPGDFVIQNGANSGVGEAVIQLANQLGVKTINIIRNRPGHEEVADRLKQLGATHILTDDQLGSLETKELVKSWTQKSQIKLGFNCVGGKPTTEMARMLSKNGHLITYGAMSRQPLILPASLQIFKNVHASGFWLTAWNDEHSSEERQEMIDNVLDVMKKGQFTEIKCSRNQWSVTTSDTTTLEERLLEAIKNATSGQGKQVFVME